MNVVNQVYETTDYSKFKTLDGNRDVNKLHVKRLKESFSNSYLVSPITINEKFEIIDGQHRFQAAKEKGLPVRFMICNNYSLKEVQLLNTNMKNWSKKDYLDAFCDLNYPEYLTFRKFMRKFPAFTITSCEALLTNISASSRTSTDSSLKSANNKKGYYALRYFEEGLLKINDYTQAVENGEKIMQIKTYYDGFNRNVFVRAMIGVFNIEAYSHDQLLKRLAQQPTRLQHCTNIGQYKLLIEEIYNYRSREFLNLRF